MMLSTFNEYLDRSALLGWLLSAGSLAVIAHGLFQAGSKTTAFLVVAPLIAIIATSSWRRVAPNACDVAFGFLAVWIAISLTINGLPDGKETTLLTLSLAAYPAARLVSTSTTRIKGIAMVALSIAIIGAIATILALVEQWDDPHGKPFVFGEFDAAPLQFVITMTFGLFAAISRPLTVRRALLVSALAAPLTIVFAAAMVRFALLAMLMTLVITSCIGAWKQRAPLLLIATILMLSTLAGTAIRHSTAQIFLSRAATAIALSPDDCKSVDVDNSIAIRKELLKEGLQLLLGAGAVGIGLDGFAELSCIKNHAVHNSFLQTTIEFGWPAGFALVLLAFLAIASTLPLSRRLPQIQFAICALTFSLLLSSSYGRISRDLCLFAALGCAASTRGIVARAESGANAESAARLP
ncbi:hypothetical protein [Bradyrhizobium elkanii]|uniref:hypothetical protein n=1 Tax=Bradyrhizobium elkanii TaxID=29448 RepID=UPI003D22C291